MGTSPSADEWMRSLDRRLAWLKDFQHDLAASADTLARVVSEEIGKPHAEALLGDLMPLLGSCAWHRQHAQKLLGPKRPPGGSVWQFGQRHRIIRTPLGTVAIIATWNYPVNLLGVQIVQALVAGNRVIVKPSERAPRSQGMLLDLFERSLPGGVLERRPIEREAGQALIREGGFDKLVFTGSTEVGQKIAAALAERMIPSSLELSGRDSAIVLSDADPMLAARSIAAAVRLNAGQTCMAPRRAIVVGPLLEPFERELLRLVAEFPPLRLVDERAATAFRESLGEAATGGGDPRSIAPTVRRVRAGDETLIEGTHFGPALAIVEARDDEHAVEIHLCHDQRLSTALYTRDVRRARQIAPRLGSTCVTINDAVVPTAHPATPFGGRGSSGWGVTQGVEGLLAMTHAVMVSETSPRIRIPYAPPGEAMAKAFGQLLRLRYGARRGRAASG